MKKVKYFFNTLIGGDEIYLNHLYFNSSKEFMQRIS